MICNEELSLFDLSNNATVAFLETLIQISQAYGGVHKYLSLFICLFGSLANGMHIYVLTRPIMQKSAVNRLLSIIALCDIFTMLSYLIFVIRFGFAIDQSNPPIGYSFHWIIFLVGHVVVSIALHTVTLYLTVATACIRYKTLKKVSSKWNHEDAAFPISIIVGVGVVILCVPTFLIHSIIKAPTTTSTTLPATNELYTVGLTAFSLVDTCVVFKANLWLTGICFKVLPCVLLMFFTVALLWELELNRRRRCLITSGTTLASKRNTAQGDRTTKVLITLLLIFLCTEFPQGVLAILNGLFPNDIHQFVYLSLGEILDLLSLINCNTCFIIYPLISSQYRHTFRNILASLRGNQKVMRSYSTVNGRESGVVPYVSSATVVGMGNGRSHSPSMVGVNLVSGSGNGCGGRMAISGQSSNNLSASPSRMLDTQVLLLRDSSPSPSAQSLRFLDDRDELL